MRTSAFGFLCGAAALLGSVASVNATVYTSDGNLADFVSGTFATFSDFSGGDVSSPFTPTAAGLLATGNRVFGGTASGTGLVGGDNYFLASFKSATSKIEVIPNIDHFGAAYDGYQYSIYGSNDGKTFTLLFNATSVLGGGEPFTLGTSTGTAPWRVNNVLTPSASNPSGTPGYEAFFSFGSAYSIYAIGSSSVAIAAANTDQELSGVLTSAPEPSTWALMGVGFLGLGLAAYRRKGAVAAF